MKALLLSATFVIFAGSISQAAETCFETKAEFLKLMAKGKIAAPFDRMASGGLYISADNSLVTGGLKGQFVGGKLKISGIYDGVGAKDGSLQNEWAAPICVNGNKVSIVAQGSKYILTGNGGSVGVKMPGAPKIKFAVTNASGYNTIVAQAQAGISGNK
jgi:hypothetical protein